VRFLLPLAIAIAAQSAFAHRAFAQEDPPDEPAVEEPTEEVPWYRRSEEPPGDGIPPEPTVYEPPTGSDPAIPEDGTPNTQRVAEGEDEEEEPHGDFYFGSYGRVIVASDLEGRVGRQSNIVTFGPRIDETDTYAELELRREDHFAGMDTTIVATIAYGGPIFHFDGEFSERIAIRNLFAETRNLLTPGLAVWAGSRMWRGDDIYLFNFWPLDNLNMIGGGLRYALEGIGELSVAGGLAQPNDPFQRQEVLVPARAGFVPDTVVFLDRPRLVIGAKLTWWPFGRYEPDGLKAILYYEQHVLPSGERRNPEGFTEPLPEDLGFVVGAQIGGYITSMRAFANVFFRYGRGLGAYDPLGVPFTEGSVIQTGRAEEVRIALSANWELDIFGLQIGAYWRYFRDADPNVFARGALTEGSIDLRPHLWLDRFVGIALDISYQGMQSTALDELTGQPEGGNIFKLAIAPFVSPFGRGTYTRPHIRILYSLTVRDDGARALYPALDPRSSNTVEHFLGMGVEWWFSSTSYGN
jgi:maltoporin